ncbi:MAG: hypothetical protein H0T60_07855 [Acidobacteria bacterium]|nr:hypothetical protein [Acidobacteriota bacterium]
MSDAAARELEDTETGRVTAGLRVRVSAPCDPLVPGLPPPRPASRRRLANLILGKAFLELLLLAALAVSFHSNAFPPTFQGSLDLAEARGVRGWVVDRSRPGEAVEVQLYLDGKFVAGGFANQPRPDVQAQGFAPDERHGFVFELDPPREGVHEARVYAVHASDEGARRTLQLVGSPLRFNPR